jgi:hypothetical protein
MNAAFLPGVPSGKSTRRLLAAILALAVVLVAGLGALLVACSDAETTAAVARVASTTTTTHTVTTTLVASTVYVTPNESVTATQPSVLASTRYEETDPHLKWVGDWRTVPVTEDGTTYTAKWADDAGASVIITFRGTRITLIAPMGGDYGIARVSLDSNTVVMVDFYTEFTNTDYESEVWSSGNLASGDHVVVIEWTGTKNPASLGTVVTFNAVDVIGTLQ